DKIQLFSSYGISKDRIIIDPGIGFGKSIHHSLSLLSEINHLKYLGCEILVGHSRKSFLNIISKKSSSERDMETLSVSAYLAKQGVDYLRVHNVEAHQQFFST